MGLPGIESVKIAALFLIRNLLSIIDTIIGLHPTKLIRSRLVLFVIVSSAHQILHKGTSPRQNPR